MIFNITNGGGGLFVSVIRIINGFPNTLVTAVGTNVSYSAVTDSLGNCNILVLRKDIYTVNVCSSSKTVDISRSGMVVTLNPVPDDLYDTLTYIQSSGTQYIDTRVTPDRNTRVYIDFQLTTVEACGIFGCRDSATNKNNTLLIDSGGKWNSGYNTANSISSLTADTNRHVLAKFLDITSLDNTPILNGSYGSFTCSYNGLLFAYRNAGSVTGRSKMKLYRAIIWNLNEAPLRDFHPAQRKSDSVYGLYDTVTETFYTNDGTGSFTGE